MNNWLQNYEYRTEISWWIILDNRHRCIIDDHITDGELPGGESSADESGEKFALRVKRIVC